MKSIVPSEQISGTELVKSLIWTFPYMHNLCLELIESPHCFPALVASYSASQSAEQMGLFLWNILCTCDEDDRASFFLLFAESYM
jgi:hypothetical protein